MKAPTLLLSLMLLPPVLTGQDPATRDPSGESEVQKATAREMLEAAEQVMEEVEELRGWEFKEPVKKDVRTRAQLREFIEDKLFEEEYGEGELERTQAWLKLLGLLPADADFRETIMEVLLSQIGGFYDPEENAFYMMVESAEFGDTANRMMIAHELCHALDDQYVDLDALSDPEGRELTEDETYVVGGVVEGSATALMMAWMAREQRAGRVDMEAMRELAESEAARGEVLTEAPPYFTLLAANYIVGQHFLTRGKGMLASMQPENADTGAAIAEVVEDLPRSSEQLLHPAKYWDEEQRDEPVVLANEDRIGSRIAEATGLEVLEENTLGEMIAALLTSAPDRKLNVMLMGNANYWTNRYGRGWGGDRLFLLGRGIADGEVTAPGAVWITAWDTVEDREEFVEAIRRHRGESPGFTVVERGRVALFALGEARDLEEGDLLELLRAARFEKDGAEWSPVP